LLVRDAAGAFRLIYVARFENAVYVLHPFQKKAQARKISLAPHASDGLNQTSAIRRGRTAHHHLPVALASRVTRRARAVASTVLLRSSRID